MNKKFENKKVSLNFFFRILSKGFIVNSKYSGNLFSRNTDILSFVLFIYMFAIDIRIGMFLLAPEEGI